MERTSTAASGEPGEKTAAPGRSARAAAAIRQAVRTTRPRRVIGLLIILWVLNIFDLAYTIPAHRTGHLHELNPIARDLLDSPWVLAGFKLLAVSASTVILVYLRRLRLAELAAWFLCLVYVALAIRWLDFCTALFARC